MPPVRVVHVRRASGLRAYRKPDASRRGIGLMAEIRSRINP